MKAKPREMAAGRVEEEANTIVERKISSVRREALIPCEIICGNELAFLASLGCVFILVGIALHRWLYMHQCLVVTHLTPHANMDQCLVVTLE
jgi:hypothetical protein